MARRSITNYQFCAKAGNTWLVGEQPIAIARSWDAVQKWFGKAWLIGFLSYERGYSFMQAPNSSVLHTAKSNSQSNSKANTVRLPNVYFGVFKKIKKVTQIPKTITSPGAKLRWQSNISKSQYKLHFKTIRAHIMRGDIYQANLTYRLSAQYTGNIQTIFQKLYASQPTPYAAMISTPRFGVASVSPELLLSVQGNTLTTHPMKGTLLRPPRQARARPGQDFGGQAHTQARAQKKLLHDSIKNKAELDMIIDIHRNDLARVSQSGSVEVKQRRRVQTLSTVWQADAVIQSTRAKGTTALDALQVLHPAGSVTGAPKLRAMEILHTLEPNRRNVYCGTIGYIDPRGNAQFNVGIRTAYTKDDMLYYHTGGGIVFDSEMENEYNETVWKSQLTAWL